MALHLVRASSNAELWSACVDRFLSVAGQNPGPTGHRAQLWLTHRNQRDLLLEEAGRRGLRGWLNPPLQFLSALPDLFAIRGKAIGLLARRELISRIGHEHGRAHGIRIGNTDATITRGNMLDAFIGELLPEGITPEQLERMLANATADEFAERRNAWVLATYTSYLTSLAELDTYDPRSIHALVADRIAEGGLRAAVGHSDELHIYGLYSTRARQKFLRSLANQHDVHVVLYAGDTATDLTALATTMEDLGSGSIRERAKHVHVQPAPDAQRELHWVASQVKQMLVSGEVEPHEVAIVARSGRDDTRRALHVLERAGIPATARVRTPLSEIAALRSLLDLYRAAAERWSYRVLRNVLTSPYFRFRVDIRPFDHIATRARPTTLAEWESELAALLKKLESDEVDSETRRTGFRAERIAKDLSRFREVRSRLDWEGNSRTLGEWIGSAERLLKESWFRFRQRICDPPESRLDVVRFDQRGVRMLEALLSEWRAVDDLTQPMSGSEWFRSLRSLLESQELVLTTPLQKGVQVLEAHDSALAPFKAVFLVHANDGEFPRTGSTTGLFSEEERNALRAGGLQIEDRGSMLMREQVLWQAVTAVDRLHISYRTTNARGTPLLPSLLVPPHDETQELPRSTELPGAPLNLEQAGRAAASGDAFRAANATSIATPDVHALRRAIVNACAEQARRNAVPDAGKAVPHEDSATITHSPWNGHLRDPFVLDAIAAKYDAQYVWSASQLQSYTNVPFFFLLERVLDLQEAQEAEEDTNALASGGVAHAILERFYRAHLREPMPSFQATRDGLIDVAAQVFHEWQESDEWLGDSALWEQRRLWLMQTLLAFVEWDVGKLGRATVWDCEHEIGGGNGPVAIAGVDVHGRAARLLVRGRIDRIDENARGELVVIDYKSGRTPSGKTGYADGAVLQGPLYIAALHAEGHTSAARALYRSIKDRKNAAELKTTDEEFARALAIALSVPARVRAGHFEAVLAGSAQWQSYQPDRSIRRTDAQFAEGSRFDD